MSGFKFSIAVKVALKCISADLIDVVPIVDNFEK